MEKAACDLCKLLAAPPEGVVIWADDALTVVAVDEPGYPGFTRVVWNAHVKEMTDLAPHERERVMRAVWAVEQAQRDVLAPHKVNVASFGNMTPHVHWHVIPRYADDMHFPNPTWGARQRSIDTNSDAAAVAVRTALLPELHRTIKERLEESHHG
ncbi:diadenosine tetraphosphate (Ap4A) HIT family hydrolase [Pseudoduganella flava]|uniref:Diadenosine tetraphosphate (Ap4A) HIT family hydrolase n=1 Tax=Pseudoduganella flava TaxID=871742 RepID=A0A562PLZ2_9BURK|nr:HIT family protein [Pseudoduganella flava]QGZ40897.1 HIT domain-containing protein [Pseudoduganella flava]TWI45429.1 diadenosine tetraphosphate (Ap4A) HIT family hydrolase [Pseudoduganella flava]